VLWQHLSIGGVANFFGYLSGGIVAWQQRQHLNSSSMKTIKKRDNAFIVLCLVWNRFYKVFSSGYSVHGTGLEHFGTAPVPYFLGIYLRT
jgi:hypothetical protein